MIKHLLSITLVSTALMVNAQSFSAKYNFALTTTLTPSTTDPTPPPTATGVTFGSFSAVGVGTVSTSNGSFTYDNWSLGGVNNDDVPANYTGALNLGTYYGVTITPGSGYEVSLTNMTFSSRRSSTGPRQYSVRTSADSYGTNLPATPSTNTVVTIINSNEFFISVDGNTNTFNGNTITYSGPSFTNFTSPLTVRFYAWNAEGTAGSFRIDSVIFNGSASLITGLGKLSFDLNSNLNVYPVPSHDGMLFIESKNALDINKIEVLDVLGNVVVSNSTKNETKIKLNLADMPNGNYFVRVYSGNSVSTKKVVVIK